MPSLPDKRQQRSARGFDRIAASYDRMARLFFGDTIHRASTCFFDQLPHGCTVLVLGCGTGSILPELWRTAKPTHLVCVDLSAAMLAKTRRKLQAMGTQPQHYTLIQGNEFSIGEDFEAEVIVTPFVLDCWLEAQLEPGMHQLNHRWKPGGYWLFSDFNNHGKHGLQTQWFKLLIGLLYLSFNIVGAIRQWRLPDFAGGFAAIDAHEQEEKSWKSGLIKSRLYRKSHE